MMMCDAARGRFRLSMVCFMVMAGLMGILTGCDGGGGSNGDDENPPTAVIDAIAPNPADEGQLVTFTGRGSDSDGSVAGYKWSSSISGDLD
ncbi:MAG: PKD domain-containing protein, partial [Desulfobacterales bacterium]|nr:PKD domain-containing protein [Desulfobacterales bacterium]